MSAYLRAKFQVSSITLTSFRQGVILPPPPPQNEPLKSPPSLGLKEQHALIFLARMYYGFLKNSTLKIAITSYIPTAGI